LYGVEAILSLISTLTSRPSGVEGVVTSIHLNLAFDVLVVVMVRAIWVCVIFLFLCPT